jgi:hypothetical protein
MNEKTNAELGEEISRNETRSEFGAWVIMVGLVIEVILAIAFRSNKSFIENWAPVLADCLIPLGVYCEIHFGRRVKTAAEELQRLSDETIAEATAQAAEANARASEAQLALEKYKAPRRLTAETCSQITDKLKPFAKTMFVMSAVGPEPIDLAIDTANALIAAGWQWKDWRGGGFVSNTGRHLVGSVALNGTAVKEDSTRTR